MQPFNAPACCSFFSVLGQVTQTSAMSSVAPNPHAAVAQTWYGTVNDSLEVMPEDKLKELREEILPPAQTFCNEANLPQSANQITAICEQFTHTPVKHAEVLWTLVQLRGLMINEMMGRLFLCVPDPQIRKYEGVQPMGKEVDEIFPKARYDIAEAFNCIALDRATAAVFHAMRVAEHGLRLLAKKLKVKLTHKGKPRPVESATWDMVITAIKNKITHAHTLPHGSRRQKQLTYYSDMADRCSYMKDLWRNDIMHTRKSFNVDEASGALQRVTDFMKLLAIKP